MAVETRHAKVSWKLPTNPNGTLESWTYVPIAVLMDIRDELQSLNQLLRCSNFLRIPSELRNIRLNTRKRKYTKRSTR